MNHYEREYHEAREHAEALAEALQAYVAWHGPTADETLGDEENKEPDRIDALVNDSYRKFQEYKGAKPWKGWPK